LRSSVEIFLAQPPPGIVIRLVRKHRPINTYGWVIPRPLGWHYIDGLYYYGLHDYGNCWNVTVGNSIRVIKVIDGETVVDVEIAA